MSLRNGDQQFKIITFGRSNIVLHRFFINIFLASMIILAITAGLPQRAKASLAQTLIFADGFESGDLSAWSGKVRDGGDLAVTSAAAMVGLKGMQARIDDNNRIYVQDDTPNSEAVYNIKFHFDPNSIAMADGDVNAILISYDSRATFVPAIGVDLRFFNGVYQLRARARLDSMTWVRTAWSTISDGEHQIEVEWDGASLPGDNDGKLKFKIDGVVRANRTGLNNDTFRIDRVRLGAVMGIDPGTRGIYFFDHFESYRN